jgi:hypothetical protein
MSFNMVPPAKTTALIAPAIASGLALFLWAASGGREVLASAPSDAVRGEFEALVQDVVHSDFHRYSAHDSAGRSMDTAKVIEDPAGGYLAIYHTQLATDSLFHVSVSASTDLMNWTFQADLGGNASQPYITALNNGAYITAWEQTPKNHLRFNYYTSRANLFSATSARTFDAPMTLSTCAEGTPSIYSATLAPDIDHSSLDVGAHYFDNCQNDRQQRGTLTNFVSWQTSPQPQVDNAILAWGVQGNIGDRDALYYKGFQLGLNEGQLTHGDFGSWRVFCYDYQTHNADELHIVTDKGSTAFANPSVTNLHAPNGKPAVFVGLYLMSQGAAKGEGGQLLYYRIYPPAENSRQRRP